MANYVYTVLLFLSLLIIHYSLENMVWDTLFPGWSGGTDFSKGMHYSLGNNVWGIGYSWGYGIHSDTGVTVYSIPHIKYISPRIDIQRVETIQDSILQIRNEVQYRHTYALPVIQ